MKVEIWSDVVCPWCYVGKRRFEQALARFEHADEVEVVWRSFELDPGAPARREGDNVERLARKYGMSREEAQAAQDRITLVAEQEDLFFDFERAQTGNTFDAHRLIHLAGGRGVQDAMKERLLAAYFSEGEAIGERETLVRLATEVGLDADEVSEVLASGTYTDEVRAEEQEASQLGISGVPFFVIDRAYGVSGAQPADVLVEALDQAWAAAHPLTMVTGTMVTGTAPGSPGAEGGACVDDSCAI